MARKTRKQDEQSGAGVKIAAVLIVLLALGIVAWNSLTDRHAPSTSRSVFSAQVVQIAPRVSSRAVEVFVRDNQLVQPGDDLFQIDPEPYELAVRTARARLQETVQGINASTSQIETVQVARARVSVEKAEYDLASTVVTAPSFGAISNLHFAVGQFVGAGTPVITFIDGEDIWISAEFRENQLGNIQSGDPVSVVFDAVPGQVFDARVGSIGWGISAGPRQADGLPVNTAPTQGFEPARRIPVRIDIDGLPFVREYPVRLGGKVDVLVNTQGSGWVGGVASTLQRLRSKLSYLY